MEHNNAKQFSLQLGALITLFTSLGSLIVLLFSIINTLLPDLAAYGYYYRDDGYSIRYSIAMLVVFFPAYVFLTWKINTVRRLGQTTYLGFTKWLIYLALLIGGLVILGDLVAVIFNFLNGELTLRFILKALTILVVVGGAFSYYLLDAREYWNTHVRQSRFVGLGTALVVIAAVVGGYVTIESPNDMREQAIDAEMLRNLETVQSYIQSHVYMNKSLPASLVELTDFSYLPQTPEGRDAITYRKISDDTFELCAEFEFATDPDGMSYPYTSPATDFGQIENQYNWNHKEGLSCFTRRVNLNAATTVDTKPVLPTPIMAD